METEVKWHRMIDSPLSEGIRNLGLSSLYHSVHALPENLPIVEVGSGNGYVLTKLQQEFPSRVVVGVDPKPGSFRLHWSEIKEPMFQYPRWNNVEDLLKEKPEWKFNSILLINWSDPCTLYDIEALKQLQPCYLLTIVETNSEIAGSSLFMSFLRLSGVSMRKESKPEDIQHVPFPYRLVHSSTAYARAEVTGWSIQCKLACLIHSKLNNKDQIKIKAPSCINKMEKKEILLTQFNDLFQCIYDKFLDNVENRIRQGLPFQWFCESDLSKKKNLVELLRFIRDSK